MVVKSPASCLNPSTFLACLFVLAPLASNFTFFESVSFGDVFVVFFVFACLLCDKGITSRALILSCGLFFLLVVYMGLYLEFYPGGVLSFARISFYMAASLYLISRRADSLDKVLSCYLLFSTLFSVMFFLQFISYKFFEFFFVYFDLDFEVEKNALLMLDLASQGFRSGGVFREPSYFSIFMAPALIYFALRHEFLLWFFTVIGVFLSTSVLGFVFILLSLFYFFKNKIFIIFIIFIILFIGFTCLLIPGVVELFPVRVIETLSGEGSLIVRVVEPFSKVFVGGGNIFYPNFVLLRELAELDNGIWLNSFCYIMAIFGAVSFLPLAAILYFSGRGFFILPAILLFVTHSMSTPYFIFSIVLLVVISFDYKMRNGNFAT